MKLDEIKIIVPTTKPRDPNAEVLQSKRMSGAQGKHRDKKKELERGKFKHKNQMESTDEA